VIWDSSLDNVVRTSQQLLYSSLSGNESEDAIAGRCSGKLETRVSTSGALGTDRVHFTSAEFYATEAEGKATLDVIRIGTLTERSIVTFRTENRSGLAGERFEATTGTVVFEPGDALKTCEVALIQRSTFDTTLEFAVVLETQRGAFWTTVVVWGWRESVL